MNILSRFSFYGIALIRDVMAIVMLSGAIPSHSCCGLIISITSCFIQLLLLLSYNAFLIFVYIRYGVIGCGIVLLHAYKDGYIIRK